MHQLCPPLSHYLSTPGSSGDPASQSTQIAWKEGKDLTTKAAMKAAALAKNGGGGRKRALESRTFFTWFCDNADPSADDIAEVIKDDMWPNPLQYFLVPDIEVENGCEEDDDDDVDEEEEVRSKLDPNRGDRKPTKGLFRLGGCSHELLSLN